MQFSRFSLSCIILLTPFLLASQNTLKVNDDLKQSKFFQDVSKIEQSYQREYPAGDLKHSGYKPFKRFEWFWSSRLTPDGNLPNSGFLSDIQDDYQAFQANSTNKHDIMKNSGIEWTSLGPVGTPSYNIIGKVGNGRINSLAIDPNDTDIMYAGAAGGGVWKTYNAGQSWELLNYEDFMNIAISHIAIDPNNSEVVYAATGDINTIISINGNQIAGTERYNMPSIGLLKSTNGGNTWNSTGFEADNGPINSLGTTFISTVIVDPNNSNRIFLGTDDGLLESRNGGASFNKIENGNFRDLKLNPINQNILHCAINASSGYRYTLRNYDIQNMTFTGQGTNINNSNRVELAVSADRGGTHVYAIASRTDNRMEGFYKSTNMGESFSKIQPRSNGSAVDILVRSEVGNPNDNGQGYYDLAIAVNPNNADEVFVGGINIWSTLDGGSSFNLSSFWTHRYQSIGIDAVHADIHYLTYSPDGSTIFVTNDGGIEYSTDKGENWNDITGNMVTTQYYDISVDRRDGELYIVGGTQDNGTSLMDDSGWRIIQGGDGMRSQIAFEDNHIYVSLYYGIVNRINLVTGQERLIGGENTPFQGGERGGWVTPFIISPHNQQTLFAGYRNLWKSTDRGNNWTKLTNFSGGTIDDVVQSPTDPNVLYFHFAGNNSRIYKTTNGGQSWDIVAQSGTTVPGFVKDLFVDPIDPNTLYYSVGGFNEDNKVWKVSGNTFSNYSSGLPNFAVNALFVDKDRNQIFAGTDVGVYVKQGGSAFRPFKNGMPNAIITDFEAIDNNRTLFAGTYGSGVWSTPLIDCSGLTPPKLNMSGEISLCPDEVIELEYTGVGTIEWNTGERTRKIEVSEPGNYFAIRSNSEGCEVTSDIAKVIRSNAKLPTVTGIPEGNVFCQGDTVLIRALFGNSNDTYLWNGEEGTNSLKITEPGEYVLTVIQEGGCTIEVTRFNLEQNLPPTTPTVSYDENTLTLTSTPSSRYQWFRNNKEISGANSRTLKAPADGDYSVEVYTSAGCGAMSESVTVTGTSIEVVNLTSSIIYPNPSNGTFTLRNLPSSSKMDMHIYSINGELITYVTDVTNGYSANLEIPVGNYIVKFKGDNAIYSTTLNIK